jgi:LAGLIDADG DNA endonuclease family
MLLLPVGVKVNKWQKIDISLFLLSHCKKLVPFNTNLDSTLGLPRLTKFIRDCTYINSYCLSVFIGILLGDANFNGRRGSHNIRISFKQSINNFPYLWLVFSTLSHYCPSIPRFEFVKLGNKRHGRLVFETRSYPVLNQ